MDKFSSVAMSARPERSETLENSQTVCYECHVNIYFKSNGLFFLSCMVLWRLKKKLGPGFIDSDKASSIRTFK